jgi:hypothetical protein
MRITLLGLLTVLGGCVGTMDSLHTVEGVAPDNGSCRVVVSETDSTRVVSSDDVRGRFTVSYTAGGPFPPKVDIAGVCNGKTVKQLKAVAPRTMGVVDLGTLAP